MKKKIWNSKSIPSGTTAYGNSILISPAGTIAFSTQLSAFLKSKPSVNFIQDEDKPSEWFIEQTSEGDAIKLRVETNGNYKVQSAFLAKEILRTCNLFTKKSVRMFVATEAVEKNLFAIITKSAKESTITRKVE